MLFTRASEYALIAVVYLSDRSAPYDAEKIAKELDISKTFLAKILQTLVKDGILNSFKGANGGFSLAKKPEQIILTDIIASAEKHQPSVFVCSGGADKCPKDRAKFCAIHPMFFTLQNKVDEFLSAYTLADLIQKKIK